MIKITNANKQISGKKVLIDINLTLEDNKVYGFEGENDMYPLYWTNQ
ncbi:hypothetical protein [Anaerococcus sp. AGMB09787]|nr:hypothetical protein [Anaerococcus sp. AGMB09787]